MSTEPLDIEIPHPSAILSSPVQRPQTPPTRQKKRFHRKSDPAPPKAVDPNRPRQTKSRNGCQTCKLKRLKCDETHPECLNCNKRGVRCGGYVTLYKWRQFDEQNITFKPPPPPRTITRSGPTVSRKSSSRGTASPPVAEHAQNASVSTQTPISDPYTKKVLQRESKNGHAEHPLLQEHARSSPSGQIFESGLDACFDLDEPTPDILELLQADGLCQDQPLTSSPLQWDHQLSTFASASCSHLDTSTLELVSCNLPAETGSLDQDFDGVDLGGTNTRNQDQDEDDDAEVIDRLPGPVPNLSDLNWLVDDLEEHLGHACSNTRPAPLSSTKSQIGLPRQVPMALDSPEMLLHRFDKYTCGIMSVRDGGRENPWRCLIWPLVHTNPIIFDSVASMACFQASRNVPQLRARGTYHAGRVLEAMRVDPGSMPTDVALASSLCLAFGESWDCSVSAKTGIDYIKVCKRLVKGALRQGRRNKVVDAESQKRLKFLCKTWIYIDVLARLTSVDDDVSNDFEVVMNSLNGPLDAETEVDPLMGCASTLFPIVGRVANLLRKVCRLEENTLAVVEEASHLQQSLTLWKSPGQYSDPEDPSTSVIHALQTAEAYRWATLLYLHQGVPELKSPSSSELAKRALMALATVPLTSRTVIVHIYPLLVAGCEARGQDREFVAGRWNSMSDRMQIGNIDRCADVVKEVWRRRDEYASRSANVGTLPPVPPTLRPPYAPGSIDLTGFPNWHEPFDVDRTSRPRMLDGSMRRTSVDTLLDGTMDMEFSARGRLHWISVMGHYFKWEVLLG